MKRYTVLIKPNSRKGPQAEPQDDGSLVAYVREPAVDGRANEALVRVLAEYFVVSKTRVTIARGHTARYKIVEIN